jgi:hypothetical protein
MSAGEQFYFRGVESNALSSTASALDPVVQTGVALCSPKPREQSDTDS